MSPQLRLAVIYLIFATGLVSLAASLFIFSPEAPGFQYDEAWWALFAHKISTQPDFRPVTGMSPYTSALPAYVTAQAFEWFGPKVAVFRGVAKLYVLGGTALLSAALLTAGRATAGALLPLVIAFFPALVMNQRWAVELNTLSVLCAGMVALGLARRWKTGPSTASYALILSGVALAITTHLFLFGSVLALWLCLYAGGAIKTKGDRVTASLAALITAAFASFVWTQDPARKETLLVVAAAIGAGAITWLKAPRAPIAKALKPLSILALPLFVPFAVHLDGNWQARQYVGFLDNSNWEGTILLPLLLTAVLIVRRDSLRSLRRFPWVPAAFLPLTLLFTYSMVGRVGARFLEIPFLVAAAAIAVAFSRIARPERAVVVSLWCALGAGQLWQNYLKPSIEHRQIAQVTRLWKIMKDSSEDFVSKKPVMDALTRANCGLSDLHPDVRTLELSFLALADWPQPPTGSLCLIGQNIREVHVTPTNYIKEQ